MPKMGDEKIQNAASSLVTALAALKTAEAAIDAALANLRGNEGRVSTRQACAIRSTALQVLDVLTQAGEPLVLADIADGVVALRRGEDEIRKQGGTRYQEICRNAIKRLEKQKLIVRVPPTNKHELMRFARATCGKPLN